MATCIRCRSHDIRVFKTRNSVIYTVYIYNPSGFGLGASKENVFSMLVGVINK